eukprot:scaffold30911_cov62-Phaeocystis_antarctica.AAC.2
MPSCTLHYPLLHSTLTHTTVTSSSLPPSCGWPSCLLAASANGLCQSCRRLAARASAAMACASASAVASGGSSPSSSQRRLSKRLSHTPSLPSTTRSPAATRSSYWSPSCVVRLLARARLDHRGKSIPPGEHAEAAVPEVERVHHPAAVQAGGPRLPRQGVAGLPRERAREDSGVDALVDPGADTVEDAERARHLSLSARLEQPADGQVRILAASPGLGRVRHHARTVLEAELRQR